jgi:zinc protease
MRKFILSAFLAFATLIMAQQNMTLPIDPQVRTGKLENGLTYYIRHNNLPEHRADFYIAKRLVRCRKKTINRACSFLEHMAFNGTENFPGKTMLEYLQNNGIKFGYNINA